METASLPNVLNNAALLAGGAAVKAETETVAQQAKLQKVTPAKESSETLTELRGSEEARYEALKRAAEKAAIDIYVVGDSRFTIYKDDGVYYTRFTSLRDGSVRIVPERQIFLDLGGDLGAIINGAI